MKGKIYVPKQIERKIRSFDFLVFEKDIYDDRQNYYPIL